MATTPSFCARVHLSIVCHKIDNLCVFLLKSPFWHVRLLRHFDWSSSNSSSFTPNKGKQNSIVAKIKRESAGKRLTPNMFTYGNNNKYNNFFMFFAGLCFVLPASVLVCRFSGFLFIIFGFVFWQRLSFRTFFFAAAAQKTLYFTLKWVSLLLSCCFC